MTTPEHWAHLRSLFDRALEVAGPGRREFVFAACGGDAALERSLAALLAFHDQSGPSLASPELTSEHLLEIATGIRAFVPGSRVARRFRVERFIAEGGMGEVYEAEDLELGESVALKTVRPVFASDEAVLARFKQEI